MSEFILPTRLDPWEPPHLNHALHTAMVPLLTLELFTVYHIYPERRSGMVITSLFAMAYVLWLLFIAFYGGFWVYPLLKILDRVERTFVIVMCVVGCAILYLGGEVLTTLVWSKHIHASKKTKDK